MFKRNTLEDWIRHILFAIIVIVLFGMNIIWIYLAANGEVLLR